MIEPQFEGEILAREAEINQVVLIKVRFLKKVNIFMFYARNDEMRSFLKGLEFT